MREVLLIEPNYRNKYPPMGLMKLAMYYRLKGDNVRFWKGGMKMLAATLVCEDLLQSLEIAFPDVFWREHWPEMLDFIKVGKYAYLASDVFKGEVVLGLVREYRNRYKTEYYFTHPRFDKVGITTLFTFYWDKTIETINFAKRLCKPTKGEYAYGNVMVGGIMASILPDKVYEATGIHPHVGLLDKAGAIDADDRAIIDELPLDYSILEETDYMYPARDAYFAYTTRGCVNKCAFCAVPRLEPSYRGFIELKENIQKTAQRFGERRDLLLLDNNVFASKNFDRIIAEIRECGFGKDSAFYTPPNELKITMNNLRDGWNDRAYIKKAVRIFRAILEKIDDIDCAVQFRSALEAAHCLYEWTATKEAVLSLESIAAPLYEAQKTQGKRMRIVDFNQGLDARLATKEKMDALATVNIKPLRIAFDKWEMRGTYDAAVRLAASSGIRNLSNYLLYNEEDKPDELWRRLRFNVDLCEELGISIYSFPMKYHPIDHPQFFSNRNYIGTHWNRKFIRAVQAVLNSTKGKIGRGREFFEEAFGSSLEEFHRILWMPETFIIYRRKYDAVLRNRLATRYKSEEDDCDLANEWWKKFQALDGEKRKAAEDIIKGNVFYDVHTGTKDKDVLEVLRYYKIKRA